MRLFKRLYNKWVEDTEEFETSLSIKRHDNFKELKEHIKTADDELKLKIAGFLVRDLGDEEMRSLHPILLLKIIAKKNMVPSKFRDDIHESSEFWILWYEALILDPWN